MRMYVKVMAAVIACILMSGETHSTSATIPATENQSWFKKRKKKPEQEEKTKSDYEKLVEGSKITKGMFAVHQKKNDYYFEIPTSLLGRDLLIGNKQIIYFLGIVTFTVYARSLSGCVSSFPL